MSPVQNHIAPGEEPFAVFVATGEAGVGDLYAVPAKGGTTFPITFSRVSEMAPALSPTGVDLAFIREGVRGDTSSRRVTVMNLLNGAERVIPSEQTPDKVAWSADANQLYVRAGGRLFVTAAPPAPPDLRPLDGSEAIRADSAFYVLVGTPAFARVIDCPDGGLCVEQRSGERTLYSADGSGPARWGSDSVGYFVGPAFFVRPLGPGRMRELKLTPPRPDPRQMTFFPGPAEQGPQ